MTMTEAAGGPPDAASRIRRPGDISDNRGTIRRQQQADGPSFADFLQEELAGEISVSAHARRRMRSENIDLDDQQTARLQEAVSKVKAKGGNTSLVMLDDVAMIVNVRQQRMVTVMSEDRQQDRVFTDIDSAVIAD